MELRWSPRFVLAGKDDPKPVREELDRSKNLLYVSVLDPDRVEFTVVQNSELADHCVEVILSRSSWEMATVRDELVLRSEDGRSWKPEPEVGRAILSMLSGVSIGDVTGETAADGMLRLMLHLEVELAGKSPWLAGHFPKLFKYHADKLEREKLKKVSGVMES